METRDIKRKRKEDQIDVAKIDTWPRFITIISKEAEKPLNKLSPFVIEKSITGMAGSPKSVKKIRSGALLVECEKKSHSDNLLRTKVLAGIEVEVKAHAFLNSSKGIIRSKELEYCTEEEIKNELKSQGITAAYRIKIKKEQKEIPTNTIILTFNKPVAPKEIKVGFLNIKVELYIPNPLRCYNCQRFGHLKKHCKRNAVCPRCGNEGHVLEACTEKMNCINCDGQHLSFSKTCPRWIAEKELQRFKTQNNVTYQDAKKYLESQKTLITEKNYAGALKSDLKKIMQHAETQTQTLPELYYKDENGIFQKWTIKENICTQEKSAQSNIGTIIPREGNPEISLTQKDTKIYTKTANQMKDMKAYNIDNMDNLESACCKSKVKTNFKTQNETPLSPEINIPKEMDNTHDFDMETMEGCSTESSTISKNKNRKTKHQTKPNTIIKTLQTSSQK